MKTTKLDEKIAKLKPTQYVLLDLEQLMAIVNGNKMGQVDVLICNGRDKTEKKT